jgi:hypothetical protein
VSEGADSEEHREPRHARPIARSSSWTDEICDRRRGTTPPGSVVPPIFLRSRDSGSSRRGEITRNLTPSHGPRRVAAAPCLMGLTLRLVSFSKTRLDDIPWVASVGVGVEMSHALRHNFSVPLPDVDRRNGRRDSIPQQREIVDLLVGRQVVESRRRKGDWCGHQSSTRNNFAQYTGARSVQLKWSHEA